MVLKASTFNELLNQNKSCVKFDMKGRNIHLQPRGTGSQIAIKEAMHTPCGKDNGEMGRKCQLNIKNTPMPKLTKF